MILFCSRSRKIRVVARYPMDIGAASNRQATADRPIDVTAGRGVAGGIEVVSCDNPCFLNTGDRWGSGGRSPGRKVASRGRVVW